MANTFYLEPTNGGDSAVWGPKELRVNSLNVGVLTCKLYNDSGTLKLSVGRIGLNDGSTGIVIVDTVTTISLAGVSASNWFTVELTRTGSTPSFTAANITGETDPASFPANVDGYYDGDKGGFYRVSTNRLIGVGFLDSGSALNGIVTMCSNYEGYRGFIYNDDASHNITYYYNRDYGDDIGIIETGSNSDGDWTKLNDGIAIIRGYVTEASVPIPTAHFGGFRADVLNFDLPITMANTDFKVSGTSWDSSFGIQFEVASTTQIARFYTAVTSTGAAARSFKYIVIGEYA